jgi:hypothetical protein
LRISSSIAGTAWASASQRHRLPSVASGRRVTSAWMVPYELASSGGQLAPMRLCRGLASLALAAQDLGGTR